MLWLYASECDYVSGETFAALLLNIQSGEAKRWVNEGPLKLAEA